MLRQELGPLICRFRAAGYESTAFVALGVFALLVPLLIGVVKSIDDPDAWNAIPFIYVLSLPIGLVLIFRGLKQRGVTLAVRDRGFEYTDPKGKLHAVEYTRIEKLVLHSVAGGDHPNALVVHFRGRGHLRLVCLEREAYDEGFAEIERRTG